MRTAARTATLPWRGARGVGKGVPPPAPQGGGPPASRDAHESSRHSAAQRTCARRTGRSIRRTRGRVGPTARDGASLTAPLDGVRNRRRAAATEGGAQARSPAGHRGRVGPWKSLSAVSRRNSVGAGGQGPSGPCDPCGRTVLVSHVTPFVLASSRPMQQCYALRSLRTRMQTATSETKSKSLDLSICVHHYTLRAPCPKGHGSGHILIA